MAITEPPSMVWRQYFPTKAGPRLVGKGPIVAMIENPLRKLDGDMTKLARPTVRCMTLGDAEDLIGAIQTSLQWRDGEADTASSFLSGFPLQFGHVLPYGVLFPGHPQRLLLGRRLDPAFQ